MRMSGLRQRTTEHFRRDGLAKKSYEDRETAQAEAKRQHMHPYKCRMCKRWHLGHGK